MALLLVLVSFGLVAAGFLAGAGCFFSFDLEDLGADFFFILISSVHDYNQLVFGMVLKLN